MTADWPDDNPSAHRAAAIYSQRVPLARDAASLGGAKAQTLFANSSVTLFTALAVDQPAFEFTLMSSEPAGPANHPWTLAFFSWIDAVTGDTKAFRTYINANALGTANVLRIQGPCRGDQLTLLLRNTDTLNTLTYDWSLSTISHVIIEDNVANDLLVAVNGFTLPGGDPSKGVIASSAPSLAPSAVANRLLPARNGHAKITVDNSANTGAVNVTIQDPDPGLPLYGNSTATEFYNSGAVGASGVLTDDFAMPPGPALMQVTNLSSTATIAPIISINQFTGQ